MESRQDFWQDFRQDFFSIELGPSWARAGGSSSQRWPIYYFLLCTLSYSKYTHSLPARLPWWERTSSPSGRPAGGCNRRTPARPCTTWCCEGRFIMEMSSVQTIQIPREQWFWFFSQFWPKNCEKNRLFTMENQFMNQRILAHDSFFLRHCPALANDWYDIPIWNDNNRFNWKKHFDYMNINFNSLLLFQI